jgi:hypothetical protein
LKGGGIRRGFFLGGIGGGGGLLPVPQFIHSTKLQHSFREYLLDRIANLTAVRNLFGLIIKSTILILLPNQAFSTDANSEEEDLDESAGRP